MKKRITATLPPLTLCLGMGTAALAATNETLAVTLNRGSSVTYNGTKQSFADANGAVVNDKGYQDVQSGDWYYNYVTYGTKTGIAEGYPDGSFKPNGQMTRAEFAAMLARYIGAQGDAADNTVADRQGHWGMYPPPTGRITTFWRHP